MTYGTRTLEGHDQLRSCDDPRRIAHCGAGGPAEVPAPGCEGSVANPVPQVCSRDGKAVSWDDRVKGDDTNWPVRHADEGRPRDRRAREIARVHVLDFVKAAEVDPRDFDVPYYVMPGKGADVAYVVLRDALRQSGMLGISRVMLRDVQHLAALGVTGELLVLTLMRFADELVDASQFHVPQSRSALPRGPARRLADRQPDGALGT